MVVAHSSSSRSSVVVELVSSSSSSGGSISHCQEVVANCNGKYYASSSSSSSLFKYIPPRQSKMIHAPKEKFVAEKSRPDVKKRIKTGRRCSQEGCNSGVC